MTYASYLVPALRRLGHKVFVLTGNKAAEYTDPDTIDLRKYGVASTVWHRAMYRLHPAKAGFKAASLPIAAAIKELFEKHELDIFEIEESGGWSLAVSRLRIVPVVVRLHGPWFLTGRFNDPGDEDLLFRRRQNLEGQGIKDAQLVISSCKETLQAVKDYYGVGLSNTRIIRIPIDAAEKTNAWHLNTSTENTLLFVGRFDKLKGGDLILKAFDELATFNKKLKLTFVGPDKGIKQSDGKILRFEDFVRQRLPESIRTRIRYRGQLPHAEVMTLRATQFATIGASQYETMGYMVLEAMSLGCPLVATAVGGIPEFIKDHRNGLLVPSQNVWDPLESTCRHASLSIL